MYIHYVGMKLFKKKILILVLQNVKDLTKTGLRPLKVIGF